jgi:hypothetical protein
MFKKFAVLGFALFFVFNSSVFAAVKDAPIMIKGIRPMGMGGAFTAVSDDENAVFYNPAGIAQRKSWLLQIFNINASVNHNTLEAGQDLADVLNNMNSDSSGGEKIDDLIKIKDVIADKDIDFNLSLANPLFISSPIEIGGNSLSFGIGAFDNVSVGVRAGMNMPRFALEFVRLASNAQGINEDNFLGAIPDDMLNETGILKPGYTAGQVKDAINSGMSWNDISNNFLENDTKNLIDAMQNISDNSSLEDGDKFAAIKEELNNFVTGQGGYSQHSGAWSINNAGAQAAADAYASATVDIPLAYKIKSLAALHIPGELSLGINLKYVNRIKFSQTVIIDSGDIENLLNGAPLEDAISAKAGASYGTGFGLDFGALYSFNPRLSFGLQISDVFTNIGYDRGYSLNKDKYPDEDFTYDAYIAPQVNIGAAYIPENIFGWNTKNRLLFAADIKDLFGNYETSFKNKLHIGAEFRFWFLAVRAGLNKVRPSVGLGLEFGGFQMSYAYYGEESYLAKMLGDSDKTVYYHEVLIAVKIGHLNGKKAETAKAQPDAEKQK